VSESFQLVLNEGAVHFLLALKARHRQRLILALESLAAEPLQNGDFEAMDDTGRPVQIKADGSFLISFWPDTFVRELRIIKLEWI
jgi:hypothetical protein